MMSWNGDGIQADRVQAYAWIDLAAEHGYPSFLATREKFRASLNENERRRAADLGKELHAKYGDEYAKKRLDLAMMREKIKLAGSQLGRMGAFARSPTRCSGARATGARSRTGPCRSASGSRRKAASRSARCNPSTRHRRRPRKNTERRVV